MNNLFDKSDVFTVVTAEQAKVGDRGYFGNSFLDLQDAIKNNYLANIATIFPGRCDCFMNNTENTIYGLFLPLDKVNKKIQTYRPFYSLDELFDFFYPPKDDVYNQIEKAEILLGKKIILKRKGIDQIKVMTIADVDFRIGSSDSSNVYLNGFTLDYLFNVYEIEKESEWVPFGIKVEEQDSKNSKDKDNSLSDFMNKRIKEISEE